MQHFSEPVAVFLLSDTLKLLVWNNQNIYFRLKQYLVKVLTCVGSFIGTQQRNTGKTCLGLAEYYKVLLYVNSENHLPWVSIEWLCSKLKTNKAFWRNRELGNLQNISISTWISEFLEPNNVHSQTATESKISTIPSQGRFGSSVVSRQHKHSCRCMYTYFNRIKSKTKASKPVDT